MSTLNVLLSGTKSLMLHNPRLANPLDPHAIALKEYTSIRSKSVKDYYEIHRLEFIGGLYHDIEIGPFIPSDMAKASIIRGATRSRAGKTVLDDIEILEDKLPILYDGPRDVRSMYGENGMSPYADIRTAVRKRQRIVTCRPIFAEWQIPVAVQYDSLTLPKLKSYIETAGLREGLGTYRSRFGRFEASYPNGREWDDLMRRIEAIREVGCGSDAPTGPTTKRKARAA